MPENQHIHCSVSNCHYYGSGNICTASEIMVMTDKQGVQADIADKPVHQIPGEPARSSEATCCKTFMPR